MRERKGIGGITLPVDVGERRDFVIAGKGVLRVVDAGNEEGHLSLRVDQFERRNVDHIGIGENEDFRRVYAPDVSVDILAVDEIFRELESDVISRLYGEVASRKRELVIGEVEHLIGPSNNKACRVGRRSVADRQRKCRNVRLELVQVRRSTSRFDRNLHANLNSSGDSFRNALQVGDVNLDD